MMVTSNNINQLWDTFQLKIAELFTAGCQLSYSHQLEAVSMIDKQLTEWRKKLYHDGPASSHEKTGTALPVKDQHEHQHVIIRKVDEGQELKSNCGMSQNCHYTIQSSSNDMTPTSSGGLLSTNNCTSSAKIHSLANHETCSENVKSELNNNTEVQENEQTVVVIETCTVPFCKIETMEFGSTNGFKPNLDMATLLSESDCSAKFSAKNTQRKLADETENRFPCTLCDKTFGLQSNLRTHLKIHQSGPLKCSECDKEFYSHGGLSLHRKMHRPSEACPYCDYSAPNPSYLKKHIDRKHFKEDVSRKKYACSECKECFYTKYHLKRHVESHNKNKKFHCPHCRHSTHMEILLKNHILNMHTKLDPFVCHICGAKTKFKASLIQHQKRHYNDKPYKCCQCSYSAVSSSNLASHRKIHEGRNYECDICHKKFTSRSHVKRHLVIHTGVKTYTCSECPYACNVLSNLRKHMSHVHKLMLPKKGGQRILRLDDLVLEGVPSDCVS